MKITNTSKAMQGVWTASGLVMIPSGESRDGLNLSDKQLDRLVQIPGLSAETVSIPVTKEIGETRNVEVDELRAELDAKGIEYDRRWGAAKLWALLET